MKELVKKFHEVSMHIQVKAREPWFRLSDCESILDIQNARQLIGKTLKEKGVCTIYTPTNGGQQEVLYINEPNLYRMVFKSRKPEAEKIQDWVFEEVLPAIRKAGRYEISAERRKKAAAIRHTFTDTLREHGINAPVQYIKITGTMKKNAGLPGNLPKDNMDRIQLAKIEAAEMLATINMMQSEAEGYDECKPICQSAAQVIAIATEKRMELAAS
jgi:prophage antirepressor-like protein